jgi:TPR repeat protein|tara:strand:- start:244 stop:900 length:657 start_codon:yes stop_codon:yes gene_type:complete
MSFDDVPENVAAVVFSHLGNDPIDRVRLAAVSKVWRSAEKAAASLPVAPGELYSLGLVGGFRQYTLDAHHQSMKAIYWLSKAVATGDADAMCTIGLCYLVGDGVKKDRAKAAEWWEKASGRGHEAATSNLAWCYKHGNGVERDGGKALELYLKAAELGSAEAVWSLGSIYRYGTKDGRVPVNKKEALKWYRVAAERGDTVAEQRVTELEAELAAETTN